MIKVTVLPPHIEEIIERHKGLTDEDMALLERAIKSLQAARSRAATLVQLAEQLADSYLTPG